MRHMPVHHCMSSPSSETDVILRLAFSKFDGCLCRDLAKWVRHVCNELPEADALEPIANLGGHRGLHFRPCRSPAFPLVSPRLFDRFHRHSNYWVVLDQLASSELLDIQGYVRETQENLFAVACAPARRGIK